MLDHKVEIKINFMLETRHSALLNSGSRKSPWSSWYSFLKKTGKNYIGFILAA
jgi:hypothetical protein